ncbi:hypothetical protein [Streptomyces sp. NBC_01190]|uniref:hypothetical protein n=1 Tax=Streptomyces sp. NBC_01190 TaxID=2903767 RepID=UPI00386C3A03|nr:hypothetical protein OG519_27955 [Streptomyces sp. NBC_01190]
MSGRRWRSAGVAAGALALLAGCTSGGGSADATSEPAPTGSVPPPVGSVAHPRPVGCVEGSVRALPSAGSASSSASARSPGSPASPAPPSSAGSTGRATPRSTPAAGKDVTVGPLTWRGLGALATGDQDAHSVHNADGWHYRVDSEVADAQVVTVTVGPDERARAGLQYGLASGMAPAPAVTFHGCPGVSTVFIGAFFVSGDGRACVPLDVRVGDGPPRRVVVSFFHGPCPA